MLAERVRLFGSRPTAAQCSSRMAPFARQDLRAAPDVPVVGVLRHDPERDALTAAADHQLGMRRLRGLRIERRVAQLVVPPLEVAAALGPQGLDHMARLVQATEPFAQRVERNTVRLVLVLLPARAETEEEPAAGDDVDLRGHLRHDGRMAIRVAQHDGADLHARDESGQRGQRAPRLEHGALALLRVRQEMVGHARDVPPGGLDVPPEIQHARPGLIAHAREQAETHVDVLLRVRPAPIALTRRGP